MTTPLAAVAATPIPKICTEWTMKRTPQQIQQCVKLGWQEPTTHAVNAANALGGQGAGAGGVIAAIVLIALALFALSRLGGRRTVATSK